MRANFLVVRVRIEELVSRSLDKLGQSPSQSAFGFPQDVLVANSSHAPLIDRLHAIANLSLPSRFRLRQNLSRLPPGTCSIVK